MNEKFVTLIHEMDLNAGATENVLLNMQNHFGIRFPEDYVEFLRYSNGAEGAVGSGYLKLWSIEELIPVNIDYEVDKFTPGLIYIGSDGGDEVYAIDRRTDDYCYVEIPFTSIGFEDARVCAHDFAGLFVYASESPL